MYLAHFNLAESPFAITPDPRFVFLTQRHREALAHLLYGLGEGGGFVQLTGEVGTGKTTVCRTLLKQLPEHVDVALIFNPQLSVAELLESICGELHIHLPPAPRSVKTLIDRLYRYLLDANARGRRTVLILDEAQNLSGDVLEEVRLLTNLETDDAKLLQVFLIAQPELRTKLARQDLRQLAQRVTARYHLEPLNRDETALYIRHRLSVAGCERALFTPGALRKVYRLTGGIPRRINILCDRALLGAYSMDAQRVTAATVAQAGKEIAGEQGSRSPRAVRFAAAAVVVLAVAAVTGIALQTKGSDVADWMARASSALRAAPQVAPLAEPEAGNFEEVALSAPTSASSEAENAMLGDEPVSIVETPTSPEQAPMELAAAAVVTPAIAPAPAAPPVALAPPRLTLTEAIAAVDGDGWSAAVKGLAGLWRPTVSTSGEPLCDWARTQSLACYSTRATLQELRGLDLPAVLTLNATQDAVVHVLMVALSDADATVLVGETRYLIAISELEREWRGDYVLLWQPPPIGLQPILLGQQGARAGWLRDTLASIDGREVSPRAPQTFDYKLLARVKDFQRERGIAVDGVVGPQTLIHLTQTSPARVGPRLSDSTDRDGVGVTTAQAEAR